MPPEKELPLSEEKIALIGRWIVAAPPSNAAEEAPLRETDSAVPAEAREFWFFRRLQPDKVPQVSNGARVHTPVDAFLLARLESHGLSFAPEADPCTLLRRLFLDLTGLPPTPDDVREFVGDSGRSAYENKVDQLLASPHFGERWGRHWLDAAGYCDVIGDDTDRDIAKAPAGKWLFRDWVVRAMNEDRSFDRFIVEQIAGDELVDWRNAAVFTPEIRDLLVATGFLRTAPDETLQNELNTSDIRHQVLAQTVEVVVSSVLGLTLQCARCHSHKYDPIPQQDYYRLSAVFSPAFNPAQWLQPAQRELPDVSAGEKTSINAHNTLINARIAELTKKQEHIRQPLCERLTQERLATLPEPIRADTSEALKTPIERRNEVQKYLAAKFEAQIKVDNNEIDRGLSADEAARLGELSRQIGAANQERRGCGKIQAVYDVAPPPPTYLLRRGNHQTPGIEVAPGVLRVLCDADHPGLIDPEPVPATTSGRRLALARWLTQPETRASAAVSRVYVNRVWQHLFGRGIVASSDNFGTSGTPPTHPELLDWLAQRFIDDGWHTKSLIRLLVTSSAYRQASAVSLQTVQSASRTDPGNDDLWRMRLRQIESEALRDAVLSASGRLDRSVGGPPVGICNRVDGAVIVASSENPPTKGTILGSLGSANRRSLYILARRRYNLSILDAFDQPEMSRNCTCRTASAVVTQALTALNDEFWQQHAAALAQAIRGSVAIVASDARSAWVREAYLRALGREPDQHERQVASQLIDAHTARYEQAGESPDAAAGRALVHLCHMLLCSNEFLYIP